MGPPTCFPLPLTYAFSRSNWNHLGKHVCDACPYLRWFAALLIEVCHEELYHCDAVLSLWGDRWNNDYASLSKRCVFGKVGVMLGF